MIPSMDTLFFSVFRKTDEEDDEMRFLKQRPDGEMLWRMYVS
jgi:hypothetical protein